jgi:hypothetical protein
MPLDSHWQLTPQQSIGAEAARRGTAAFVVGCIALIGGDYADTGLIRALAGPAAERLLDGQPHDDQYWFRVWGARGLLWVWRGEALTAIVTATRDDAWRVREMAAKVVARHVLGDAWTAMEALRSDPVPRVRAAADRAVNVLVRAQA